MPDLDVPPPDAPADTYRAQVVAFGSSVLETKFPSTPRLRLDMSAPLEHCLAQALAFLKERCTAEAVRARCRAVHE
jgi:hypothetical protein